MVYYIARKEFGLSVQEWQALPWWESCLLLEGWRKEQDSNASGTNPGQPGQGSGPDLTDF